MHKLRLDDNVAADLTEFEHIVHIPIERSEIHPRYNSNTSAYDFWMIKLKWNADSSFPPVHLQEPADLPIPAGRELTTMGFGTTEDGFPSNVLREVTVKYVTNPVCADMYVSLQRWIFDSMLCAAATDKDSCLVCIVTIHYFCSLFISFVAIHYFSLAEYTHSLFLCQMIPFLADFINTG
jgi:hypothetical protein